MSKEALEELQLWYRPRTEPSGTMNVPSEKFSNHNETQSLLNIPADSSNPAHCEVQDLLIVTSEGTTSVDSSESSKQKSKQGSKSLEPKKKRSHKKKEANALNTPEASKSSNTFEPIVIIDDSDTPKGKKLSSIKKAAGISSVEKPSKQAETKINGKALQKTVKKTVDAAKSGENTVKKPLPSSKPSDSSVPAIESSSKPADSLPKTSENPLKSALKPKKVPKTPSSPVPPNPSSENKNVKSECSEFIFQCPNSTCSQSFGSSEDFINHIKTSHSLRCKMPFCTYSTYTFQEYSEHFEQIHCVGPSLPQKRGPRVSLQEGDGRKEAKTN